MGAIEPVCLLLGGCPSLRTLDMRHNPLGAAKAVMTSLVAQGAGASAAGAIEALQQGASMLHSLPAVIRAGSKAKDLLIAVLTSSSICELRLDPTLLSSRGEPPSPASSGDALSRRDASNRATSRDACAPAAVLMPHRGGAAAAEASQEPRAGPAAARALRARR